jgi:hypothetical protein
MQKTTKMDASRSDGGERTKAQTDHAMPPIMV